MLAKYSAESLQQQLSMISEHGFCVMDNFIRPATISALADEVQVLSLASKMHDATTGRTQTNVKPALQDTSAIHNQFRGDAIYWLDESAATTAQQEYFVQMEALRLGLNQQLYLGLYALETHLALYPIGSGYKKHLDRFSAKTSLLPQRQISCILYLNQDWQEVDGGKLRLYLNDDASGSLPLIPHIDINPIGGRLILFLSDSFYHEVLPTNKQRASLTGWFLTR
jgi:SM-20-related protein